MSGTADSDSNIHSLRYSQMACRMSSSLSYSPSSQRRYSNRLSSPPLTRPSALSQDQGPLGPQIPRAAAAAAPPRPAPPPSRPFNSRCRRRRRIFCVLSVAVCRATPAARSPPFLPGRRAAAWAVLTLKILSSSLLAVAAAAGRGERRQRRGRTLSLSLSLSLFSCAFVRSLFPLPLRRGEHNSNRRQLQSGRATENSVTTIA